jgi:hypothetical protein
LTRVEEAAPQQAGVGAGADDVVGVVQHRGEEEHRGDRGGEGDAPGGALGPRGREQAPGTASGVRAFVQNVRRGHSGLAAEEPATRRLVVAFDELAVAI